MTRKTLPIAVFLTLATLTAQKEPELPRIDDLSEKLDEIEDMVRDRKMLQDFQAITKLRQLIAEPDKIHEKDQARIAKSFANMFRMGRVRPPKQIHLYRELADALAQLGEDGAKYLHKAIEDSRIKGREHAPLRAHMLTALGRTKVDRYAEYLLEQALRSPDDVVMAAAGGALGEFTELELRDRREIVEDLIGRFGEWHMKTTQLESSDPNGPIDFSPQNAMRTLNAIRGPWNASLTKLTGQRFTAPTEWTHWLNKNRDWDPPQ